MNRTASPSDRRRIQPTDREVTFGEDEIIVSKTDLKGRITYANDVFLRIAGFSEQEVLGQPHSIVRHPDMPRAVFQLLWDTLQAGRELFAYVKNITKSGDYYWVFAHVTPSFDTNNSIVGYHSNRRCPNRDSVKAISELYAQLLAEESRHTDRKVGQAHGHEMLTEFVRSKDTTYEEIIHSL